MKGIVFKISAFIVSSIIMLLLIYFIKRKNEDNRSVEKQNLEKIKSGDCSFDAFELKKIKILVDFEEISRNFPFDSLKIFADSKIQLIGKDSSHLEFRKGNCDFQISKDKGNVFIDGISIGKPCNLKLFFTENVKFESISDLDYFSREFPKSYACKSSTSANEIVGRRISSLVSSPTVIRINNTDRKDSLEYLLIFFSEIGDLQYVAFNYKN
jgi:hypothetical protein